MRWILNEFESNSEKLFNSLGSVDKTPKKEEVTAIDRRKALTLLSVVALLAIMSTVVLTYAADNGEESSNGSEGWFNGRMMLGPCGRLGGWRRGGGRYGPIEVSEEYEENVINIAESDPDVQGLLNDGYSVVGVRPIITTRVDAEGNVVAKATNAIVVLEKDTASNASGNASVWVNLEEAKVTKIVIFTTTVIEKS